MANISQVIREEEGNRLRAAYQRMKLTKHITQTHISTACGWRNASTFNRLLTGKIALTLESLVKLATVLGVAPSAISPRLIQDASLSADARISRQLPVSLVKSVTRGSWGEPFITEHRLPFFTADPTAFALTFDPGTAPALFEGWVVVVEPASKAMVGDWVIIRQGVGKYSCGRVQAIGEGGCPSVEIDVKGVVLTSAKRCMLVSSLCRPHDLQ